jgi:hypothetical protein
MSGTTFVGSTLPMAVLCTNDPATPGAEPSYKLPLVGERDPNAIHGTGITEGVDVAAFDQFIARNPDFATSLKKLTQAEVDALHDTSQQYGHELGLQAATAAGAGDATG